MAFSKLCCALILLSILTIGHSQGQCTLKDIKVAQRDTGRKVKGKPEVEVTVSNECICTQQQLKLDITGFMTQEGIDPLVFDVDTGLVNKGGPVYFNDKIIFKYAWDTKFPLLPVNSQISCS